MHVELTEAEARSVAQAAQAAMRERINAGLSMSDQQSVFVGINKLLAAVEESVGKSRG